MLRRGWSPWVPTRGLCQWSCCCPWSPSVPQSCHPGSMLTCRGCRSPRGWPMVLQISGAGRPKGLAGAAGVLLCAPSSSLLCWHSSPIPSCWLLSPRPLAHGLPGLARVAVPSQPCLGPRPQRPLRHLHINGLWPGVRQGEPTLIRVPFIGRQRGLLWRRQMRGRGQGLGLLLGQAGVRSEAGPPGEWGGFLLRGALVCAVLLALGVGQGFLRPSFCPRVWLGSPQEVADRMGLHRLLPT